MRKIKALAIGFLAGCLTTCGVSTPAMADSMVADLPDQVVYITDEESELCIHGTYLAYRYWVRGDGREDGCWTLNEYGTLVQVEWPDRTVLFLRYEQLSHTDRVD